MGTGFLIDAKSPPPQYEAFFRVSSRPALRYVLLSQVVLHPRAATNPVDRQACAKIDVKIVLFILGPWASCTGWGAV